MPDITPQKVHLFTDLDRTLLPNGSHTASPNASALLFRLHELGLIELIYVTGRSLTLVEQAIKEYGLPRPEHLITDVGTHIYSMENNTWRENRPWRTRLKNDWPDDTSSALHTRLNAVSALTLQEAEKQTPFKLSYYFAPEAHAKITTAVHETLAHSQLGYKLVSSIDEPNEIGLLDLLPPSADKLEAIRFLIETLDINPDYLLYSGDSGNDLPVITSELNSLLVKNADEDVQTQALRACREKNLETALYIARGDFFGFNGHYAAGILEGLCYYFPHFKKELAAQRTYL